MLQYKTAIELLEIIENLVDQDLTASDIFLKLRAMNVNSFTNREWTMPALQHVLLTLKRPEHRSASVVAQLLKAREATA